MSLQRDLDAIAEQQGKTIPPGHVIQGFGPGDPPPPSEGRLPGDVPRFRGVPEDDDWDERAPEPVPSPMIPRPIRETTLARAMGAEQPAGSTVPSLPATPPEAAPVFDLTVIGNDGAGTIAAYQGRQVELSSTESAAIRKVVLTAISRTIREQLAKVEALLPKRKRRRAGGGQKPAGRHGEGQPGSSGGFVAQSGAESPAPLNPPKKRGRPRKNPQGA